MKHGVNLAPFGAAADPRLLAELAREAEDAGWDGFFLWDHINWRDWGPEIGDPWVGLSAIAVATRRIRIGCLVTPLPRRRPTTLARQTVSLDHLCGGRLVLGVGLGSPDPEEFEDVGEEPQMKRRGQMTDEALELLGLLWSGEPVDFRGQFYRVRSEGFLPRPLQRPRIPVWVAAVCPFSARPLRRAAAWDGVVPMLAEPRAIRSDEVRQAAAARPAGRPFEVLAGAHSGDDPQADRQRLSAYREAGATWWLEPLDPWRLPLKGLRHRIRQGPISS
ncbi:MAG: LLM class flavin-dependent oxidoreductase [Armatimonadetes bacterium]|nr:LLM class flavin-dependent oxidoreductase [Armatimonadota bacterium]